VAPGASGAPGHPDDMADHPMGGQGGGHCKTWLKLQHLQVARSAEWEGFIRPTSLRATTREGIGHGHKPAGQVAGKERDGRWRKVKKAQCAE
jgi:hypothetical protein